MEAVFVRRLPVVVAVDRSRRAAPAVAGRRGGRTGESLVIEREKIVLVEAPHLLVMRQRDDISRGRWRRPGSASVGSSGSVEPRDPRRLWGKGAAGRPAAVEAAPVRQLPIAVAADGSRRARPAVAGRPASKGLVIEREEVVLVGAPHLLVARQRGSVGKRRRSHVGVADPEGRGGAVALDEAVHEVADARGVGPQLVGHAHLATNLAGRLQLAAGEGICQDVRVASAVSDYHPVAEADELGQLLKVEENSLHEIRLRSLLGEAEGRGERVDFRHDQGVLGHLISESLDLTVERNELSHGNRELELGGGKRGRVGVTPAFPPEAAPQSGQARAVFAGIAAEHKNKAGVVGERGAPLREAFHPGLEGCAGALCQPRPPLRKALAYGGGGREEVLGVEIRRPRQGLPEAEGGRAAQAHDEDERLEKAKEGVVIAERERARRGRGDAGKRPPELVVRNVDNP